MSQHQLPIIPLTPQLRVADISIASPGLSELGISIERIILVVSCTIQRGKLYGTKIKGQMLYEVLEFARLKLGMGVSPEPEKPAPFFAGMGIKIRKKMGMGRVW